MWIAFVTMNARIPPAVQASLPVRERTWPGRLVTLATVIVVAAVAAGTFVLSYSGVHSVALQSGVSASLARYYPAVFDAVLVIGCAAAPLRDARLWARLYTWLVIFIVIGLLAAMDAVHAMGVALPRRQTAGIVAVLPWVLLLLAFTLWLVVLRHFRIQQSRQLAQVASDSPESLSSAPEAPGTLALPADRQPRPALPAGPAGPTTVDETPTAQSPAATEDLEPAEDPAPAEDPEPAEDPAPETAPGDPASPEATEDPTPTEDRQPAEGSQPAEGPQPAEAPQPAEESGSDEPGQPGQPDEVPEVGGVPYATGPRLHRVRSLPVPPADDE